MFRFLSRTAAAVAIVGLCLSVGFAAEKIPGLDQQGKPDMKSAGHLTFGPPGVLFVGDSMGAALFAIGVDPAANEQAPASVKVDGIDGKLAAALGTQASDITINDMAVQPRSGIIYLSASRGKGPDAAAVLATVNGKGEIKVLPLDNVAYGKVSFANVVSPDAKDRRGNPARLESITDLRYIDGKLYVAGLSNEEFASKLRGIAFPFSAADNGTSVEIYHGNHAAVETRSPVRTFIPVAVNGQPHILAAYTCTPLVTFPVAQLTPGSKVRGKTIAEVGNQNTPLDIVAYKKDGHDYLLMSNDRRGVMKFKVEGIEGQNSIEQKVAGTAGLGFEPIAELAGVEQLDKLDEGHAVIIIKAGEQRNLQTVNLP